MPEAWSALRLTEKKRQNHPAHLEKEATDLAWTKRMGFPKLRWQEGHFLEREQNAARKGALSQTERWAMLNVRECFRTLIHKYSNKHKGLTNSERAENSHPLLLVFPVRLGIQKWHEVWLGKAHSLPAQKPPNRKNWRKHVLITVLPSSHWTRVYWAPAMFRARCKAPL